MTYKKSIIHAEVMPYINGEFNGYILGYNNLPEIGMLTLSVWSVEKRDVPERVRCVVGGETYAYKKLISSTYVYGEIGSAKEINFTFDKPIIMNENETHLLQTELSTGFENPNILILENPYTPVILHADDPGFGDHHMFSNLPEAIYKKYGKYTYISKYNKYRAADTKGFIWDNNPYVIGVSDLEPNFFPLRTYYPRSENEFWPIYISRHLNLPVENHVPKIYVIPKKLETSTTFQMGLRNPHVSTGDSIEKSDYIYITTYSKSQNKDSNSPTGYEDHVLVDFSGLTFKDHIEDYRQKLNDLLSTDYYKDKKILCPLYSSKNNEINRIYPDNYNFVHIDGIQDIYNILCSFGGYVGYLSGTSALAGSVKEYDNPNLNIVVFDTPNGNSKVFTPPNINVIQPQT